MQPVSMIQKASQVWRKVTGVKYFFIRHCVPWVWPDPIIVSYCEAIQTKLDPKMTCRAEKRGGAKARNVNSKKSTLRAPTYFMT